MMNDQIGRFFTGSWWGKFKPLNFKAFLNQILIHNSSSLNLRNVFTFSSLLLKIWLS